MIARIWHGRTRAEHEHVYAEYVRDTGIEAQRGSAGNLGSLLLTRVEGDEAHFIVLSLWESMDAVVAFAGDEPEKAVYFPQDDQYLLEMEPHVLHYDVPAFELP